MIDVDLALPEARQFAARVSTMDSMWDPGQHYLTNPAYIGLKRQVPESPLIIRLIADECDPDLYEKIDNSLHGGWGISGAVDAANQIVGFLEKAELREAITSPRGPKLAAADMHRWIWGAAAQLWDDGYHRQAVQTAASSVFDANMPAKLSLDRGSKEAKPEAMVGKAFDENEPLLTIPGYAKGTQDWTNAYQGAKHLGLACAKLVRNLGTHNVTAAGDEDVLLEELAMLSRFARIVDSSAPTSG